MLQQSGCNAGAGAGLSERKMSALRNVLALGVEALQQGTGVCGDNTRSSEGLAAAHRTWADAVRCSLNWTNYHAQTQLNGPWSTSPVASPPQSPPELDRGSAWTGAGNNSPRVPADFLRTPSTLDASASQSEDEEEEEEEDEAERVRVRASESESENEETAAGSDSEDDGSRSDEDAGHDDDRADSLRFQYLTLEDEPEKVGAPGWLLQQLQSTAVNHTCKAGFLQMGMDRCCGDSAQESCATDELPPEGWETRRSRRDGRTYFFNVVSGESRWPRQRRCSTDREIAAARCKACRAEWIALHDGSQHRRAPTAAEAIALAQLRLSAGNAARRTLAYQLLAFSAAAHGRLGNCSVACILPIDLQEKIGRSLNWHHVGAAAATQFTEQGWAWKATACFRLRGGFSLGSITHPTANKFSFRGRPAKGGTPTATASRRRPDARRRRQPHRMPRLGVARGDEDLGCCSDE